MTKYIALAKATHWPQALAMVTLATVASFLVGQHGIQLLFVALATAFGQASVGWVNDYVDARIDKTRKNKPTVRYGLNPRSLRIPIVTTLILLVPFSFLAAGIVGGFASILAVGSAQIYNLYLSRTIWSWLPYAVSFALLPVFVFQSKPHPEYPCWQLMLLSSAVGVIAHIFSALPDLEIDKKANLGGMVVSLGRTKSVVLLVVLSLLVLSLLSLLIIAS